MMITGVGLQAAMTAEVYVILPEHLAMSTEKLATGHAVISAS